MAEIDNKKVGTEKKPKPRKSDLIGHQAKPVVLNDTTKLDVDVNRTFMDHMIMAGLSHNVDTEELNKFTTISNSRETIYQQLDVMFQDSSVSSIGRTYTEDVCEVADNGHIVWAESNDPKISKHINYLLNVANIDKNIYGWAYSLIKYGDVYLKLFRESDYDDDLFHDSTLDSVRRGKLNEGLDENIILSTHRQSDPYSYYVEMVSDPSTMFELTKYGKTYGFIEVPNAKALTTQQDTLFATSGMSTGAQTNVGVYNFKMKSDDVIIHQADEYVHAYLDDGFTRFPETVDIFIPRETNEKTATSAAKQYGTTASYSVRRGKSLFYDAYKIWREKQLLEAAALLSRLTRSSVIRKVGVEMGNTSKEKSAQILRAVKEMFEQRTAYNTDSSMSEYNNPGATENFIYHAIRDGKGAITVDTVGGDYDPKSLVDLDWWNNKFYGSFGIPKQYFGWTDDGAGFNGGTALTVTSSVYGKGVKRVQNALIQALSTMIDLFLVKTGCKAYLNNYTIKMKFPLTQEELSYRENLTSRVNAISSTNALFTDVETKSTRLRMLKNLVSTLNYGDDLIACIDAEIKVAKEAEEKAKEAEEEAANAEAAGGDVNLDLGGATDEASAGGENNKVAEDLNLDLGDIPSAPDTPKESFKASPALSPLTEDTEFLDETTDLPKPEELGDIDFSENN